MSKCSVTRRIVRVWPVSVWYQRRRERQEAEFSRTYKEAYERVPLNAPDAWGDMESFYESRRPR